ncbi:hypothetical protein [Silvanigrella aquatica]|uniref:DNA-directed DNA polymerase n=1 Tax=Silvanigrella aquatica TaxID=1915309 RepID=A0A1L4D3B4_9BACT|nr:hypothetical protein [Silvanigrella aquatica]APJ04689.1 hypothetical protein AXG55_12565 [Silvanigrella aquatica]
METSHVRKSLGEETTFAQDIISHEKLIIELNKIIDSLCVEINKRNLVAKTLILKIKYFNFKFHTKSKIFPLYFHKKDMIQKIALELFDELYASPLATRLMGLSVSNINH